MITVSQKAADQLKAKATGKKEGWIRVFIKGVG
jgi:hypothetical protein